MEIIRTLYADEIDCRVGIAKNQGCSILLYKDSRVDMALLDELVGPMNWQRDHKELKGVIYCGVGIYDPELGAWCWKWDAGTESNTEPQKGEASDSFKRACVNWGIGRELYTAPFIWVKLSATEWNGGKPRVSLKVAEIDYDEARRISRLVIVDSDGQPRYSYNAENAQKPAKRGAKGRAGKTIPAETSAPAEAVQEPAKEAISPELYEKSVAAAAEGKLCKSGRSVRDWYIESYAPGAAELAKFDADVQARQTTNI